MPTAQLEFTMFIQELALQSFQVRNCVFWLKSGHSGEISKIAFNPQGSKLITAGVDQTARIWNAETGDEQQVLEGEMKRFF